jgi:hypothetical protein
VGSTPVKGPRGGCGVMPEPIVAIQKEPKDVKDGQGDDNTMIELIKVDK